MRKIKLLLSSLALVMFCTAALAQNITVKGTVKDASTGEGIPFASVMLKGTMTGTATDANGAFSLSVPSNGTLVFSFVGYDDATVAVNGKSAIEVSLQPSAESLEETVVVAYGTAKKSSFTGSATSVKSEKLTQRTVSNVTKAIEGMVAGVTTTSGGGQPGSGSSIVIRGIGSVNAGSTPLYVVDGIPYDGSISAINPNDIENLTILKDASAAALYGSRGSNGVVMITTKRGQQGNATVNFKATFGLQQRSLPRYEMVNQNEFVELTFEALRNEFFFKGGYPMDYAKQLAAESIGNRLGGEAYNPYKNYTWATLIDQTTGKIKSDAVSAWNEDWMDELTNKKAFRQEYQVGVTGGDAKTKYTMSVGYLGDKGVLKTTEFQRFSARTGVDHNVTKWLSAGLNASYSRTNSNQSQYSSTQTGNAWYTAQFMAPIYPVYLKNMDGTDALDENGNRQYDYGDVYGRPKGANFNAVGDLEQNFYESLNDNASVRGNLMLGGYDESLGALKGLTLAVNFGYDLVNSNATSYYNPDHGDGKSTHGAVSKAAARTQSYTFNQILKYDRKFADHHILAQAGHEYYAYNYKYLSAERTDVFPGIPELAPTVNVTANNSYSNDYKVESYFGRLNYDYADKYYVEATFRADGSSRFYKDARWGKFWSVGASWRISEENFMKNVSWIDNATLRVSYGQLGNDSVGLYAWQSFYDLTWPNATNAGAVISSLENKAVTWEKKGTVNAGIDLTLFKNKINLVAEYYHSITTDMLLNSPMAMSTGFTGFDANMGSMKNTGFEITLRYNWLNTGKFRASSTVMAYRNKNTVLSLDKENRPIMGTQVVEVGKPIYTWYVVKTAGVDPATGRQLYWAYERDKKTDEKIEGSDYITADKAKAANSKYYMGDPYAKLQGSFGSDFQLGPVDFSFLTTFAIGGLQYNSVYIGAMEATYIGDTWSKHALRRWQVPGDVTDVPAIMVNSGNTTGDRALIDGSYFAIKSIQLGYTLPQKATAKAGIKALRFFAVGDNIQMFNKLKGFDPQYSITGGQGYSYAPTRTFSLGVDITF